MCRSCPACCPKSMSTCSWKSRRILPSATSCDASKGAHHIGCRWSSLTCASGTGDGISGQEATFAPRAATSRTTSYFSIFSAMNLPASAGSYSVLFAPTYVSLSLRAGRGWGEGALRWARIAARTLTRFARDLSRNGRGERIAGASRAALSVRLIVLSFSAAAEKSQVRQQGRRRRSLVQSDRRRRPSRADFAIISPVWKLSKQGCHCGPSSSPGDDIVHLALSAGEEQPHVVDDHRQDEVLIFDDVAADMRCNEDVRQVPERAVGRQRLGLEYVKTGAGDAALAQRRDQRRLVDGLAAAGADVIGRRPHRAKHRGVEQRDVIRARRQHVDQVVGTACRITQAIGRCHLVESGDRARRACDADDLHA